MKKKILTLIAMAVVAVSFQAIARDFNVTFKSDKPDQVIQILEKETGYGFVFQKDAIKNVKKPLSGTFKSNSIEKLLDDVVNNYLGLDYEIIDKTVVLRPMQTKANFSRKITGKVFDETGEPVIGAFVLVEGTQTGTATDIEGEFSLEVNSKHPKLVVRYVGMQPKEITINDKTKLPLDIRMDINYSTMSEVVVTGYQNIKRENATGAYNTITAEDMERRHAGTITENLEGKVAGLVTNSQESGEQAIVIRGVGTLNATTKPLVVVDGLPIEGGIETVNPYDIANVTVLKDAAAASIYGARAANGVIVITTKRANSEKVSIDFNTDITLSEKNNYDNFGWASAADVVKLEKYNFDYVKNQAAPSVLSSLQSYYNTRKEQLNPVLRALMANHSGDMSDGDLNSALARYSANDYRREYQDLFEKSRLLQQYNLAIRVQGKALSSSIVVNYRTDNLGTPDANANALTFKYRGDLKVTPWLDMAVGLNVINERGKTYPNRPDNNTYASYRSLYEADGSLADMTEGIYENMAAMQNPDYGLQSMWQNPVSEMTMSKADTRRTNLRSFVQATAKILPGWTASANFQYEDIYYKRNFYQEASTYAMRERYNLYTASATELVWDYDDDWNEIQIPMEVVKHYIPKGGQLDQTTSEGAYYTFRAQTEYEREFLNKHNVNLVAGFEYRDMHDKTSNNVYLGYDDQTQLNSNHMVNFGELTQIQGQPSVLGDYYAMYGAPEATSWGTNDILHRFYSIYFTGNYVYDTKYAISGSWRLDKSDLFGADPKFRGRPLWSVGASWNIHNESFMHDIIWISALKPRISYGLTGNIDNSVSSFLTASIGQNIINGDNCASINRPPYDQLRWEKTATWNFGVDFAFFNYRLSGSLDYYHKKSTDLLSLTDLDPTTGWTSMTINNAAALNRGIELSLSGHILQPASRDAIGINAYGTFSYNKNKIIDLNHEVKTGYDQLNYYTFHKGYPVHALFSYDYAGLETDENGNQHFLWRDADGNVHNTEIYTSEFRPEDAVYSGSLDPKVVASLTPEITWKGFSLSGMLSYYGGHVMRVNTAEWDNWGSQYGYDRDNNLPKALLNYWESGQNSNFVANGYAGDNTVGKYDAKYMNTNVVPADYLKLRNIVLSYDFDSKLVRKIGFQQARLRFQMNNVGTWVRNKAGKDPEAVYAFGGDNLTKAPRSYTFSIFLNF